jgi:hypothetical protein
MTDDQTRAYDAGTPGAEAGTPPGAATPNAPVPDAATPDAATPPPPPPVAAAAPNPRGPSRARWVIALGVVGVVIALTIAGALLLGTASAPEALKYVPADAGFVAEVRMDLPGDQLQKVGNLLAHFPGFADQSTLSAKLDEAFGRVVTEASDGQADFVADIKPWLNGPLFLSGSVDTTGAVAAGRHFVASATVNGGVDCAKAFEGRTLTHEQYKGLDIASDAAAGMACAVDGRFALLGDPASVKAAVDAKAAGNGMDKSAEYLAARRQLTGDQLATVYVNGSRLKALAPSPDPSLGIPGLGGLSGLGGEIPAWVIVGARAEDNAVVVDAIAAPVAAPSSSASLLPAPPAHASVAAPLAPASTLVYVESQGTGVAIQNLFSELRTMPDFQQPLQVLDGVGGAAGLAGWIDDVAVAIAAKDPTLDDPHVKATVFLVGRDEAAAADKLTTLKSVLGLAGIGGGGITVTTETLSGVEVTTVTITDLGALLPPGSVPGLDTGSLDAPVTFSIAAKGRVLYLSIGDGAMADALAVQAGASLADDASFKLAAQRGLANSKATMYVAVGATVDMVKGLLPSDVAASWATEYAPYVEPLQAFGISVSMDPSANRSRMVLTVSNP